MADIKEKVKNTKRHPWEVCRAKYILKIISECGSISKIADIGAGDLFFSNFLVKNLTDVQIVAIDSSFETLDCENDRITKIRNVSELPKDEYDLIILMDVLEHVEHDYDFLNQIMSRILRTKKSYIIITVPAHQKLFSNLDRFLIHYRRYDYKTLEDVAKRAKLNIISIQYFFASLYLARMFLLRFDKPIEKQKVLGSWKFNTHNVITLLIIAFLSFDLWLGRVAHSLGLPWMGLSLFMLCENNTAMSEDNV